jgi:hypothetical protein
MLQTLTLTARTLRILGTSDRCRLPVNHNKEQTMRDPHVQMDRRNTLAALLGAGGAAIFIPAWNKSVEAADAITCVGTTPTTTEGPYWVDEKLFRSDIRTDPTTGTAREGVPLTLTIYVQNLARTARRRVRRYLLLRHPRGIYSDEPTYNPSSSYLQRLDGSQ